MAQQLSGYSNLIIINESVGAQSGIKLMQLIFEIKE